jgi:hypothetical protein
VYKNIKWVFDFYQFNLKRWYYFLCDDGLWTVLGIPTHIFYSTHQLLPFIIQCTIHDLQYSIRVYVQEKYSSICE